MKKLIRFLIPKKIRYLLWKLIIYIKNIYYLIKFKLFSKSEKYFEFDGLKFRYFSAFYNSTFQNERAIEIPIALFFIKKYYEKEILEIGNVMSHYFKVNYDIVDKYEKGRKVINSDIIDFNFKNKYDLIVSISTFEHIGFDEVIRYGNVKNYKIRNEALVIAIEKAKNLLNPEGLFIFTAPLGFNSFLDSQLVENKLELSQVFYFKRISANNEWKQVNFDEIKSIKYGQPYNSANGLLVGLYRNI